MIRVSIKNVFTAKWIYEFMSIHSKSDLFKVYHQLQHHVRPTLSRNCKPDGLPHLRHTLSKPSNHCIWHRSITQIFHYGRRNLDHYYRNLKKQSDTQARSFQQRSRPPPYHAHGRLKPKDPSQLKKLETSRYHTKHELA
ncbi:hypothetical protein ACLB2K_066582 [Fragaria x ananassa]